MKKPKRKNKDVLVPAILVLIMAGAFFVGSKKRESSLSEKKEQALDEEAGGANLRRSDELPASFPEDFPVHPEAKIEGSFTAEGEGGEGVSVIWQTSNQKEQVYKYYKESLGENGWTMSPVLDDQESVTFSFEKGGTYGFMAIAKAEADGVIISVTIGARLGEPSL